MKPLKDFSNKLDVSDINGKVLQRVKDTNPLEPRYTWQDTYINILFNLFIASQNRL
jgi:hypothetical protein